MKYLLALIAIAFLSSCVTTGAFNAHLADVSELRAGTITEETFESRTSKLKEELEEGLREQEEAAVGLAELATGGVGLATLVYGAFKKAKADVHRERDTKYVVAAPSTPGGTML